MKENRTDVSEKRPYLRLPNRQKLPHDPPHFIGTSDATFFVTICCVPKGFNHLCRPEVAKSIFSSAQYYYDQNRWSLPLLLLMPDHVHMLVRFSSELGMKKVIRAWKRYTARTLGIRWQRDFFDHRLRNDESLADKASYVQHNPVRAGLMQQAEDWPYQLQLD